MLAWFGGITVDLHEATLAPGAQLSVHALFGGIVLDVPQHWRLESRAKSLAGGIDVKTPKQGEPDAPVLTLDGLAVFGGVAVMSRGAGAVPNGGGAGMPGPS
jgi:hypothetical protein